MNLHGPSFSWRGVGNDLQGGGLFWVVSLNFVRVGSVLMIALIAVEMLERQVDSDRHGPWAQATDGTAAAPT